MGSTTIYLTSSGSGDVDNFNIYSGSIINPNALIASNVSAAQLSAGYCLDSDGPFFTVQSQTVACQSIQFLQIGVSPSDCALTVSGSVVIPTPTPIPQPIPQPTPNPVPTAPTPNPVPVAPQPVPVAPTPNPVPVAPTPNPVPVAPQPVPVAPQPVPVAPQPVPQPVPAPAAPVPQPVAPVPQPAPVSACTNYDVTNDGCSGQSGANQVTYTMCGARSPQTATIPCGDAIDICAENGTVNEGADLTLTNNGICT
jgi:hypothetical protein